MLQDYRRFRTTVASGLLSLEFADYQEPSEREGGWVAIAEKGGRQVCACCSRSGLLRAGTSSEVPARAADGPYAERTHGPSSSIDYLPVAAWLQSPANATPHHVNIEVMQAGFCGPGDSGYDGPRPM